MPRKIFLKRESITFKIIYVIGIISFFAHLNALTTVDKEQSNIFPFFAFSILILFFIRLIISDKTEN